MYFVLFLYISLTYKLITNIMKALINTIENLELKRDLGTITMTEETILCRLIEQVEYELSK